jgi:hypothetical protein
MQYRACGTARPLQKRKEYRVKPSNPSAANLTVKVVQGFLVFIVLHKLSPEIDFSGIKPVGPCLFPYS